MITVAVSLVVWLAVVFSSEDGAARYGVFTEKALCEAAVAEARASGVFVSDCLRVEVPSPKNGKKPGA